MAHQRVDALGIALHHKLNVTLSKALYPFLAMNGFIDFAGKTDTALQWLLCGWSDRAVMREWQGSSATVTLRGARERIPASICSFSRSDIGSGAGLLIRFEWNIGRPSVNAWTSLGRVELSCEGERLPLVRASGASVLPKAELKRRLRDVLPYAVASELREQLFRFAFNGRAQAPFGTEDTVSIAQLIERRVRRS